MNPSWFKLVRTENQCNAVAIFHKKCSLWLIKSYAFVALILDAYP